MILFNTPRGDLVLKHVQWVGDIYPHNEGYRFDVAMKGDTIFFADEDLESVHQLRGRLLGALEKASVFDYLEQHKLATQMLEDYGKPMILKRSRPIVDPVSGGTDGEQILAEQEVIAVRAGYEQYSNETHVVSDARFYISAKVLDPLLVDLSPHTEMRLVDSEIKNVFGLKRVRSVTPGINPLIFDVQA